MPAPNCYGSIQACRLRVGALDAGGAPDPGLTNLVVTDALIQVQSSYNIETGQEFTQKNGCGEICQTFKEADKIKSVGLELQLCQLDYELIALMLDANTISATGLLSAGSDVIGYDLPPSTAGNSNGVSVEAWTKAWDGGSQPVSFGGDPLWHHFVWPKVTWVPGQRTLQSGILVIPLTGTGTENPQIGDGPNDDFPVSGPQGAEQVFLDDTIPDAVCGAQELVAS
jgi:hypothetical protein